MRAVRRPCVLSSSQGENDDPALTAPVGRPLVSAVTGTNGKTTVATATLQLLRATGLRAAGCDSTGIDDVHGSLEAYWGATLRLFEEHLRPDGVAVLATDCAQWR